MRTGKLKLPLSSSPEMHNNSQAAWFTPNSNNDLAILRWLFAANEELAAALGRTEDARKWKTALLNLDELAVEGEAGALRLSPDESQTTSHRHLAHLMAIYPLGILHRDGTDRDRAIIAASLEQLDRLGDKAYCGYSHAWRACLMARSGQPGRAGVAHQISACHAPERLSLQFTEILRRHAGRQFRRRSGRA